MTVAVTFITEQHVGLRTYSENLQRFVDGDERLSPTWRPVTYQREGGLIERLRFVPDGIRGLVRGWLQVRSALAETSPAAVLYLTQVPAAIGGRRVRSVPYVIMMDDTPRLYDDMSHHYGEAPDRIAVLRWWKHRTNTRALRGAAGLYPMSAWAQQSLLDDYGVAPHKVHVLPTGIDLDTWSAGTGSTDGVMRILFVGGNLERKGGDDLIAAFRRLEPGTATLHLVTRSVVAPTDGITVSRDLDANTEPLREAFRSADVFVLPSRAEAFPNVVVEAAASGLPSIVTRVGGMEEMVIDGETGFVIDAGDVDALTERLVRLAGDPRSRAAMRAATRRRAEQLYDGRINARTIADALLSAVSAD